MHRMEATGLSVFRRTPDPGRRPRRRTASRRTTSPLSTCSPRSLAALLSRSRGERTRISLAPCSPACHRPGACLCGVGACPSLIWSSCSTVRARRPSSCRRCASSSRSRTSPRTRYGQLDTRRCQAAERRTATICGERRRIRAQLDEELFVLQPGLVCPMQARLISFLLVCAQVTGLFGEWSAGLAGLLASYSQLGAHAWMARMGAPSRDVTQAALERHIRRQFAACVVRGHAQLLLARAQRACGQAPPQRRVDQSAQGDVDACGGVFASCRVPAIPAVPAATVHRLVALSSDLPLPPSHAGSPCFASVRTLSPCTLCGATPPTAWLAQGLFGRVRASRALRAGHTWLRTGRRTAAPRRSALPAAAAAAALAQPARRDQTRRHLPPSPALPTPVVAAAAVTPRQTPPSPAPLPAPVTVTRR